MSLEKALEANTAAVLALTEILNTDRAALAAFLKDKPVAFTPIDPSSTCGVTAPKKQEEKASAPSKAKAAPVVETPASTAAEPDAATSTLTYEDIQKPFLAIVKRGPDGLAWGQALIAEFGFKTLKDAKPEQYAEILAKLNANSEEGMA